MKKIKKELEDRGLLYQFSNEKLFDLYDKGGELFYCGFDPTADSLHLGNFIGFMVAVHIMRRGNKFTALTGGATGMIGDPGGKDSERTFLSETDLDKNQGSMSKQISNIVDNLADFTGEHFKYDFVNNKDFYKEMGYLDFLREVGKYITVNVMMSKDTVKKRIEDPSKSISYTEFSYMLVQGYDFSKLFIDNGLKLQIGGQDQWGNLVTGTELIRKKYDAETYVLTWPLITDSTGKKFGKSEGNAIWLDKNKTSSYEIYQYFMNTSDCDVSRYLKMLTLLETEYIDEVVAQHMKNPENREGQKLLAYKVVEIIHGTKEADLALKITDFMFGNSPHPNSTQNRPHPNSTQNRPHPNPLLQERGLATDIVLDKVILRLEVLKGLNDEEIITFQKAMGGFVYNNENLFEIIVKSGLSKSNTEARQAVQSGAVTINEQKISDFNYDFSKEFINDKVLLLGKGKKTFRIISK